MYGIIKLSILKEGLYMAKREGEDYARVVNPEC